MRNHTRGRHIVIQQVFARETETDRHTHRDRLTGRQTDREGQRQIKQRQTYGQTNTEMDRDID